MATAASATRIMWSWQSNLNPWNDDEVKEWQRYSDLEIELIEREYQKSAGQVELGDYVINFKQMLQYKKWAEHRQRRVKREKMSINNYLREERFAFAPVTSKAFEKHTGIECDFLSIWVKRNGDIKVHGGNSNYREILKRAIKGNRFFCSLYLDHVLLFRYFTRR
jgi:hypothetical protein